jgi:hypothetical protein
VKNFNANAFTWFVLVGEGIDKVNRGGSYSFRGYSDHANAHGLGAGKYIEYVTSRDANGRPVGKYFTLDESRRRFQVREGESDINQITQYSFFKNCPDCEGSPNGYYIQVDDAGTMVQQGIMFRELNTDADAGVALEAESRRIEAQASATKVDDATLQDLGAFIGVFGEPGKFMRLKVVEWAGKRPVDYFKVLNSGDRAVRAVVRKALEDGVFSKRGSVIYWQETMIGADEDAAIATLLKEPRMMEALQKKVDLKTEVKAKSGKGRPPGSKNKPKETGTTKETSEVPTP